MFIRNLIIFSIISAIWQTSVHGKRQRQLLLILEEGSKNTIWSLWSNQSWTKTGLDRQNMTLKEALSHGEYRSSDIDIWKDESPNQLEVGAYNGNGDRLWMLRFNSTSIENNPRSLFSTKNFIDSTPVSSPSMKIVQSESGFALSLVCDNSSIWFQVITNKTGTYVFTSVDQFPHRITKDWEVAFKVSSGAHLPVEYSSVYDIYDSTNSLNENDLTAWCNFTTGSKIYKSSAIDEMLQRNVSKVKLALYKDGTSRVVIEFDSFGKDKFKWLDCNNILYSTYLDISSYTKLYCSVSGHNIVKRRFFIQRNYYGCPKDEGWITMKDVNCSGEKACPWDSCKTFPYIIYAPGTSKTIWSENSVKADALVVFVNDPTTNTGSESDHIALNATDVSLPYTFKIDNIFPERNMFVDGIMVKSKSDLVIYYEIFYSTWRHCFEEVDINSMKQYVTQDQVKLFLANGNRMEIKPIPFKCVYVSMCSDVVNISSLEVTLYIPKNKLMDVSYLAIYGLYETADNEVATPISNETISTITDSTLTTLSTMPSTSVKSTSPYKYETELATTSSNGKESTIHDLTLTETPTTTSCKCTCLDKPALNNMTLKQKEEVMEQIQKIRKELKVEKKNLSSSIRKKISVQDNRPTAASVGYVGVFIISFVFGLLIIPDILHLLSFIVTYYKNDTLN